MVSSGFGIAASRVCFSLSIGLQWDWAELSSLHRIFADDVGWGVGNSE